MFSKKPKTAFPGGHLYSPVVDPETLDIAGTWPAVPEVIGIDFNDAAQREILTRAFPRFHPLYDYPDTLPEEPLAGG